LISVIAPCLNEQRYLPGFLTSLGEQSWRLFELIIIDGGSTDKSRHIIDAYEPVFYWDCGILKLINNRRNLGFIRNLGAHCARGDILFFTNTDAWIPKYLLRAIEREMSDPKLLALSGRTIPWNGGSLSSAAHAAFDLLRWGFSKIGKFSPSGNFLAVKKEAFWAAGGFPEISVNEDGVLGNKLSSLGKCLFLMNLWAGHYAKRWNRGALKTLLFYSYVFGNFSPTVKKLLRHVERKSAREFNRK